MRALAGPAQPRNVLPARPIDATLSERPRETSQFGVIFVGIATPVEAAGIGTIGALFVSVFHLKSVAPQEITMATIFRAAQRCSSRRCNGSPDD